MIKINRISLSPAGYAILAEGNDGEDELFIHCSNYGDQCKYSATAVSVAGGLRVQTDVTQIATKDFPEVAANIIRDWTRTGVEQTSEDREEVELILIKAFDEYDRFMGTGNLPPENVLF